MTYRTIIYDHSADVATIRLNRPDRMNALNAEMRRELLHAVDAAVAEARALILTGLGKGFCAGQDLGDVKKLGQLTLEQTLTEEYAPLVRAIADCPIPTICAVNGAAAGAGANLALAADICIAAESASFLQAFVRIGLIPDAGGTYWLPRQVGMDRAMGMSTAAEWGLIWEAVPDAELQVRVHAIAATLAAGPTAAIARTKTALRASFSNTLDEQLALEASLQGEAGETHDFREGVMAFLEKRAPGFRGR